MIRILPEILSNKIAAGEVVERPASVVKELVENALDAGSRRIMIEIERGGQRLVRVSDDGVGMSRDDAMLAVERYATSKIYSDADLFSISTLGFRGEALPSIASVSKFSLITREKDASVGTAVDVEGGKLKKVSETGAPAGTMITVKQLFYNTPARRKFLKTIGTEMGHIADTIASTALGQPGIQLRLQHDGRSVKDWPGVTDPIDRVVDVLGKNLEQNLCPLDHQDGRMSISGWICNPRVSRRTSKGIYVFTNGRWVRDPVIQHALFEGYAGRLMKGQFPVAVLFLRLPFDEVDVNVHPAKQQVRFHSPNRVHDAVRTAVFNTLKRSDRSVWALEEAPAEPSVSETVRPFGRGRPDVFRPRKEASHPVVESATPAAERIPIRQNNGGQASKNRLPEFGDGGQIENQKSLWVKRPFGDLKIIGQLHETYILCQSRDGLILLDQHAAHERIRFEQLKTLAKASETASQKRIVAETLDLSFAEADTLKKLIPELWAFGLDIEPFGGNTFAVKSIPALLGGREIKPLVMEMIDTVAELGGDHGMEKILDRCLILMACHGTVRANQALTEEEIRELLCRLDACENSSHCPHGRPIWLAWSLRYLEKSFHRIV
jgi:DNA mismatch repair protein MutL